MEIKGQQPVPDGSLTEQDDTETSTAQASSPTQETVAEQDNGAETVSCVGLLFKVACYPAM